MELKEGTTQWQRDISSLLQTKFKLKATDLHASQQDLNGVGDVFVDCVRYDTKEYPWALFERFLNELPSGVQVQVVQSVEVTAYHIDMDSKRETRFSSPYRENFETQITTKFLFLKV